MGAVDIGVGSDGGNDGVLLCRSGEHIRTAHWLVS